MSSIPYIRQGTSNVRMPKDYGYVYEQVNNWAALDTLLDPEEGDIVNIRELKTGVGLVDYQHKGQAIYTSGEWKLIKAEAFHEQELFEYITVDSYVAMNGCIGIICGNAAPTGSSKYYHWDSSASEWLRTPDGIGYVHPDVEDWEALGGIIYPKDGDQVFVTSLDDVELSNGIAKWSESNEQWELQEVTYSGWDPNNFSDAFVGTIANGAIIKTDDGSQGAPIYFWNSTGPEWVRSPEDVNYLWPSTTLGTWGSLNTDGKLNGDRISVPDWTAGGSDGVARYDGTNWKLVEGVVDTITNLGLFIGEKEIGAKVTVGTGVAADPVYFWSGTAWLRTADGSHYIWPQVHDWAALSTRPHAIINDEVHVQSLGTHQSSGTAQRHGGTWKLIEGKWATVADMNDWAEGDIHSGAIGFVDAHPHHYDEDSTVYYRVGSNWVRMAKNVPVTFTLSSLQDFSGLGLKDGDYGIYTPSGGAPILVRYKEACDVAPGAGDGTLPMWLPPQVYAGSPEIKSYIVGSEANDSAIINKGWTIARTDTGTVGTVGGYMQLRGPTTAAPTGSSGTLTSPAFTGATKFYLVGEFRGAVAGSDPYAGIFGNATASIPVQYALGTGNNSFTIRQKTMPTSAWTTADTPSQIMNGGLTWPATVPYLVQALSGAAITDLIETRFDGELYSSFRRDFDSAGAASSYSFLLIANGGGGSTTSTLEFRNLYFVTY